MILDELLETFLKISIGYNLANISKQTYAGVKAAGNLVRDRAMWDDANEWLADKR